MPAMLLADRFVRAHGEWFDIATGERVLIAIRQAGPLRTQIDWAERCAMLARLRHPLLNALVDFGIADRTSFFEAYAAAPPLALPAAAAANLAAHLGRFLAGHGVAFTPDEANAACRRVRRADGGPRLKPVGLVLQPRRALAPLMELFAGAGRGGATLVQISGPPASGLRTFAVLAVHTARMEGYVPVCPHALLQWPVLVGELAERHLCIVSSEEAGPAERAAVAALLARAGLRSTRPHVLLSLSRGSRSGTTIHLDQLGTTSMTSMVYIDRDFGPSPSELFEAATRSGGLPGRFLARLAGGDIVPHAQRVLLVRETAAEYCARPVASRPDPSRTRIHSRIESILWQAGDHAATLHARGRHAAAARRLARAARALEARGHRGAAAACWRQLAWIARNRGALKSAQLHAERARDTDDSAENQILSAHLTAVCWTDEGRFAEAEASLQNLAAAAELCSPTVRNRCLLALGRVRHWQGRQTEAAAAIEPLIDSADPILAGEGRLLLAKIQTAARELPAALRSLREAARLAAESGERRLQVKCSLARAAVLCSAGDADGVRAQVAAGLELAQSAHLPIIGLRLRAVLLRAIRDVDESRAEARRLRRALGRALKRPLPCVVARELEVACADPPDRAYGAIGVRDAAAEGLVAFLEIAQRSTDDLSAVQHVASALCERLGAVSLAILSTDGRAIATAGKPWRDKPAAALQAIASGRSVDAPRQPPEAAEPVRCGGELIGAIACRWLLGAVVSPLGRSILRAGAMALGTHLRAVVDSGPGEAPPGVWGDLLGDSAGAAALREAIHRAARAPFPVLIEGESGSGKELVARAIHRLSPRRSRRFCAINCAALTDELVEAELFGHTRGAFTGATTERPGLFEEADGGTLFLDEIGELSPRAQAKLLRVVQEGEVRRIGENHPRRVDVRIVAATNRHLEHEAVAGRFRTDLRFRLDVLRIVVPPLRDRIGDIPLLAQHFWRQACARVGSSATLGPDALAALARHDWPGNVRELQNAIAWIAVHAPRRGRVSAAMLPAHLASSPMATGSFEAAREEFERRFVRAALAQAGGQRQVAARALGISRQGLTKMLRRLGIEPDGA